MNNKLTSAISLGTATLALTVSTSYQPALSSSEDKVSFSCQEIFDTSSEQIVPATVAYVPQRGENVPVIYWKSDYFSASGWDEQARCQEVTPKFQALYDTGRLNYLTYGKIRAYPVICATVTDSRDETCNGENQLFTLKHEADGEVALKKLMNIIDDNRILYNPPIRVVYVDFNRFLLEATALEEQNASN